MNKILIALVLAVVMSGNVYAYKVTEKELRYVANEINKSTPIKYAKGLLLESVDYLESFTLVYNYRFSQHTKNSIGDLSRGNSKLTRDVCTNPDLKLLINQGVTFISHYYDKDWVFVHKHSTSKYNC